MLSPALLLTFLTFVVLASTNDVIHFSLHRRGGRFAHHQSANLSSLLHLVRKVEDKYSRTYRSVESNKLVRRWSSDCDAQAMLDEIGLYGNWYATINIGDPPQALEVDLDLLSSDFYTTLTTSDGGSKFDTFASQSFASGDSFVHSLCRLSSDNFLLPHQETPVRLDWPVCQPSKSSRHTLSNSGTVLGLAPNTPSQTRSLSRLAARSFVHGLHQKGIVQSTIWSITLLDSSAGILSIGGTLAAEIEEVKTRTEVELKYLGQENVASQMEEEVKAKMAFAIPAGSAMEDYFQWTDVSGASGWWTGLMNGVWVDGVKILKNQPFLIDLSCPFVIAPPTASKHLYSSIGGSKPLSQPIHHNNTDKQRSLESDLHETFHLYPCLNPPSIAFELGGWPFPFASPSHSTREDAIHGPAGGPFSLGKVEDLLNTSISAPDKSENSSSIEREKSSVNSGFCVGIVVSSDMGEREDSKWRNSGMRDTWVLGEPFFRGMGVVFDDGEGAGGKARMGFRVY